MAGRVTLLILTTVVFGAAWSSDREPVAAAKPVPAVKPYAPEPVKETALRRWKTPAGEQQAGHQSAWRPTATAQQIESLPAGIPAGTYLVVDEAGKTQRVVVPLRVQHGRYAGAARDDHFAIDEDGRRRHWIRLSNPQPSLAQEPPQRIE